MDFDRQQLAAIEQKIEDLVSKKTHLQVKIRRGTITDEEEIELAGIGELLADARESKKNYAEFVKLNAVRNNIENKPTQNGSLLIQGNNKHSPIYGIY